MIDKYPLLILIVREVGEITSLMCLPLRKWLRPLEGIVSHLFCRKSVSVSCAGGVGNLYTLREAVIEGGRHRISGD